MFLTVISPECVVHNTLNIMQVLLMISGVSVQNVKVIASELV
jgi:hypothetical protein